MEERSQIRRIRLSTLAIGVTAALAVTLVPAAAAQAATTAATGIQIKIASSNKCLNVSGASTADKAKIVQYGCTVSASNDRFVVVAVGSGQYQIKGVGSGKCLNVDGNSMANGANIIQYTCGSAPNTLWKVDVVPDQPTIRFVSVSSGKCLNISGGTSADNAQLIQYGCTSTHALNEQFYLPPTASPVATHRPFTSKQPVSVLQGVKPAGGDVAPVYYSYIRSDNQFVTLTDLTPDPKNPNKQPPLETESFNFGYTGRTDAARLADGRVEVTMHDAAAGDVQTATETTKGTGLYSEIPDIGGTMAGQPNLGPVAKNRLAVYGIIDGALWYAPQTVSNDDPQIGAWRSLGGPALAGTPVSVQSGDNARIFALNAAGHVLTALLTNDGTALSDWSDLGGSGLTGTLSVVIGPDGTDSVFALAGDGSIVTKKQSTDGSFPQDWTTIGVTLAAGSPSAVVNPTPGQIAVAVRGTDNQLYTAYETGKNSGQYSGWGVVTPGTTVVSDPTAFSYDVPSGASYGVAFETTGTDTPYVVAFDPPAASARTTAPKATVHKLGQPKKKTQLAK